MSFFPAPALDWVLFDADDTLFDFNAFAGLSRLFAGYGVEFTKGMYEEYQALNRPLWLAYQAGQIQASALQEQRFTRWSERLDVSPAILNAGFLQAMAEICTPLPGAVTLLDKLKQHYRLGIITNGFSALQQIRLERTALAGHFELLVVSEEVGVAKPAKAIFDHALTQMGHPERNRVLMVGDSLASDVQGGLNAGLVTCWFNPARDTNDSDIVPHKEVQSHAELGQWLSDSRPH